MRSWAAVIKPSDFIAALDDGRIKTMWAWDNESL
jgi:hypothetical protein